MCANVGLCFAVKTCALPLKIKVVLEEPGILFDVGNACVGARTRCNITSPLLRKIGSVQGDVGNTTRLVVGVSFDTQDLEKR